jgi:hypothetical protein
MATPELSFAIRQFACHGGLNISASHNPPDDNGGKFYDERGAQPVPPDDQIMAELVEQVQTIRVLPWTDAVRSGKVHFLDDSLHKAYLDLCRRQSLVSPPRFDEVRIVFTPLHGVGSMTALEVVGSIVGVLVNIFTLKSPLVLWAAIAAQGAYWLLMPARRRALETTELSAAEIEEARRAGRVAIQVPGKSILRAVPPESLKSGFRKPARFELPDGALEIYLSEEQFRSAAGALGR